MKKIFNISTLITTLLFFFSYLMNLNGCSFPYNGPVDTNNIVVESFPPGVLNSDTIYYVDKNHPAASDLNEGTVTSPWASISHAVNTADSASKVIVKAGDYNEQVTIETGGTNNTFFIVEADGTVNTRGFLINADYVAVKGFTIMDVTPPTPISNGCGFRLNANYIYILNNKIYNFTESAGITTSNSGGYGRDHIQIENNYIYGCNQGIGITGSEWLVINNELERLIRGPNGFDADYIRFFGDTIVIKNNFFHGTVQEDIGESHTDIFQTYWNNDNIARNILIQENMAIDFYHQGIMAEASGNSHDNIMVYKNIFADAVSWGVCNKGITNCRVENNIFYDIGAHDVGFRNSDSNAPIHVSATGTIKNNIFMDSENNYWKEDGCSYENGYNLIYPDTDKNADTDISGKNPLFINPSNIVGPDNIPFSDDDGLRLQSNSPAINAGENGVNIGPY